MICAMVTMRSKADTDSGLSLAQVVMVPISAAGKLTCSSSGSRVEPKVPVAMGVSKRNGGWETAQLVKCLQRVLDPFLLP